MSKLYAVVAGVGPGTGAAIAKKFAKTYPVVLLGRTSATLESVGKEIASDGGKALCLQADVSERKSIENALDTITSQLGSDYHCAVSGVQIYSMSCNRQASL